MDWKGEFFQNLESVFKNPKDGIEITFHEERLIEKNLDFSFSFEEEKNNSLIKIEQILKNQNMRLNWVKCNLEIEESKVVNKLSSFLCEILNEFNKKIEGLEDKVELGNKNTLDVTKSFKIAVDNYNKEKNEILEKCALLLNSKKS